MILSYRCTRVLRGIAVAGAAALTCAIAGCEAGANAPTQRWHQPTPGASAVVNDVIRINNVFVLGPPPGATLSAGQSAGLFLAVANNGAPDRLLQISAPGAASTVSLPAGGVSLGAGQSVFLTGPAPQVVLENLAAPLSGGEFIRVVMEFQRAGSVALDVPVMPQAAAYATFSPAAPASPPVSPSSTPASTQGLSPSASPTASPGG